MSLEAAFLQHIASEPENVTHRLIYADWLEEQGDPRGELLRIQEQLRQIEIPDRERLEVRMQELLRAGVEPLTIQRVNSVSIRMNLVFPGSFLMGSPETEAGRHREATREKQVPVTLTQPFWLGAYVVTQEEWQAVMETTPWRAGNLHPDVARLPDVARCPVSCIGWRGANAFCSALTKQERQAGLIPDKWAYVLPTEAQWEYACRAGTTTPYFFGADENQLEEYAWYQNNTYSVGDRRPQEVGLKQPNPWGFYDIYGNVEQFCRDWFESPLPGGADPVSLQRKAHRSCRGGSLYLASYSCRSASRDRLEPGYPGYAYGFRLALVPPRPKPAKRQ